MALVNKGTVQVFFSTALFLNGFFLLYISTNGFQQKVDNKNNDVTNLNKKIDKIEDAIIKNERRTFESIIDLDQQLKSSVKRFQVDENDENKDQVLEQEKRRHRIKEVCRQYKKRNDSQPRYSDIYQSSSELFSQTILYPSFLIDPIKTRSVYCYNFKSAASTWMRVFAQLYSDSSFWDDVSESQSYYKVIYKMSAPSVQRVHEVFESGDYFTFMVVRNPLIRILSGYRDRILSGCTAQSKLTVPRIFVELKDPRIRFGTASLFDRNTNCIKIFPTFLEFVKFLILRPESHDEHWMSYAKHCSPCLLEYDAVVKLETSAQDENFVLTRSKINQFAHLEFQNPTKGGKTDDKINEYFATIPCGVLEDLIRLYQMDIEMFDYNVLAFREVCQK